MIDLLGHSAGQSELLRAMGRAAPGYGQGGSRFLTDIAERVVSLVAIGLPDAAVLDVATGPGVALAAVQASHPRASLYGIDLSSGMVDEARRRLSESGVEATIEVMDAEALAFPGETFDVVLCCSALYQFPRPDSALSEFRRVLRPGGRVGISIFGDRDARWDGKDQLLADLAPNLAQVGLTIGEAELRSALREAGFQDADIRRERLDVQFTDAAAWLDASWSHGERRVLDAMDERALSEFTLKLPLALEAAREEDDALHWRPEVIYAVSTA